MGFKSPPEQRRKFRPATRDHTFDPSFGSRRLKIDLGINLAFNVANRDRRKIEDFIRVDVAARSMRSRAAKEPAETGPSSEFDIAAKGSTKANLFGQS